MTIPDKDTLTALAAVISAGAAFVAPIIAYAFARRQQRHADFYASQQAWVSTLREKIALLIAVTNSLSHYPPVGSYKAWLKEHGSSRERLSVLRLEISLMLHLDDEEQLRLNTLVRKSDAALNEIWDATAEHDDDRLDRARYGLQSNLDVLHIATRTVLDTEWARASQPLWRRCWNRIFYRHF